MRRAVVAVRWFWGLPSIIVVDVILIAMGAWWAAVIASAGTIIYLLAVGFTVMRRHFANPS